MALHFNFKDVLNYEEVTTDPNDSERWHPVADALIWLSMICGYSSITSKNVDAVTARIMAYQAVTGSYLRYKGESVYIMPEDVYRFIGMRTNATPKTDAQWLKHLGKLAQDQGNYLTRKLNGEFHAMYKVQLFADAAKMEKLEQEAAAAKSAASTAA